MPGTYRFRFRAPAGRGGLAADLVADAVSRPDVCGRGMVRLHGGVLLALPPATYWEDAAWLSFGASLSAPRLAEAHPAGLLIDVHSLDYPLGDYRSEVAALAMDGWLREEFGLPPSGADVHLGAESFVFAWGEHPPPFTGGGRRS